MKNRSGEEKNVFGNRDNLGVDAIVGKESNGRLEDKLGADAIAGEEMSSDLVDFAAEK